MPFYTFGLTNGLLSFSVSTLSLSGQVLATTISNAPGTNLTDGQPHTVAATVLSTALVFYVDGRFLSAHTLVSQPSNGLCGVSQTGCTPDRVFLGTVLPSTGPLFLGTLGAVVVYAGALAEIDIAALFGAPFGFSIQPQCRCQLGFPRISPSSQFLCYDTTLTSTSQRISQINAFYPEYANDGDLSTRWQAPRFPLPSPVLLTVDLQGTHQLFGLNISFLSLLPGNMVLEASQDGGNTWLARQYFSRTCSTFGVPINTAPTTTTQAICSTAGLSFPGTSVNISVLTYDALLGGVRPGATDPANATLQAYLDTTHFRLRLIDSWVASGTSLAAGTYVAVAELTADTRCECSGHSATCNRPSAQNPRYSCNCLHNTTGALCDTCPPLYNNKPWRRGVEGGAANGCKLCQCNGHASSCHYNVTLDAVPSSQEVGGGGVCDDCGDNTTGQHCDACIPGMYHVTGLPISSPATCVPCNCSSPGVQPGNNQCADYTAACNCKANVEGLLCDRCKAGFYGLDASPSGCSACSCNASGSLGPSCDAVTGQCVCAPGVTGQLCDTCPAMTYGTIVNGALECSSCDAQCSGGCSGAGPSRCIACVNVREAGVCVSACSGSAYPDSSATCQPCGASCIVSPAITNFTILESLVSFQCC